MDTEQLMEVLHCGDSHGNRCGILPVPKSDLDAAITEKLMAAVHCVYLGLRISECLALEWSHVDWIESRLDVERGIVRQRVADTKTQGSRRALPVSLNCSTRRTWKQTTELSADADRMFASPTLIGRQPWCYDAVLRRFTKGGEGAGIGPVLLTSCGTPIAHGLMLSKPRYPYSGISCVTLTSERRLTSTVTS